MITMVGIAVSALILSVFLRNYNKTFSTVIIIAASVLIFFQVLGGISDIFDLIKSISANIKPVTEYIKLMVKVLGITLISQFISDMCRDCGEGALASTTELGAKIIVITMILPLFETVIKIVTGLVE